MTWSCGGRSSAAASVSVAPAPWWSTVKRQDPASPRSAPSGRTRSPLSKGSARPRATPDSTGVHRRTSGPVWLLSERRRPDGESVSRQESARDRRTDPAGAVRRALPLFRQRPYAQGHPALRQREDGMTPHLSPDARTRARPRRVFAALLPQGLWRACRRILISQPRRGPQRRLRPGLQRNGQCPTRCLDRDRARRHRHGLYREVRLRPGSLHRADAAGRRRSVRSPEPRPPRPVRYVGHAGPGHDLWTAVASDELQPHQPGARRRHCAPGVDPPGIGQARRPSVRSRGAATVSWRSRPIRRARSPTAI